MAEFIQTNVGNGVALISLRYLPGAVFCVEQRREFLDALRDGQSNNEVEALVISGEIGAFGADYPLEERLSGDQAPTFAQLCTAIRTSRKPVVTALRGPVYDAGFELALSAHARVVHQGASLRLSRLQSGRLPSPEALHTLARELDAESCLHLLNATIPMPATLPGLAPLFAQIVRQNTVGHAAEVARDYDLYATEPMAGHLDPLAYQQTLETARAPINAPEQTALIDALEAAQLLPETAFLEFVAERDAVLAASPRSRALAYERGCDEALMPNSRTKNAPRFTLIGTNALAHILTFNLLDTGASIDILELEDGGYDALRASIQGRFSQRIKRGSLTSSHAEAAMSRLKSLPSFEALAAAEYAIECGAQSPEDLPALARSLRQALADETPLLITSGMRHSAGHFASSLIGNTAAAYFHVHSDRILFSELAFTEGLQESLATAWAFQAPLEKAGLAVLVQKAQDGLCSARLLTAYVHGAEECLARGASVAKVNAALAGFIPPLHIQNAEGFGLQPFRIRSFFMTEDTHDNPPALGGYFHSSGIDGRNKTQAFEPDSQHLVPKAAEALERWRQQLLQDGSVAETTLSPADIRQIVNASLYCVSAQLLETGIMTSPWKLDFLSRSMLARQPAYGGPFFWAQAGGLLAMRTFLRSFKPLRAEFFVMPDRLDDMIKTGGHYAPPSLP
ncbi:hypothetical protein KO498_09925 [Lentibacter algarum]|uniref:enoyl-CoA hydratase/isomerase family protein n=1 Tax=Lentibacter algarum TaxID=576131 RepID=UPI001C06D427|nr:hypothetical protein [Lentibacter algarum]